jgi:hypothetical protein
VAYINALYAVFVLLHCIHIAEIVCVFVFFLVRMTIGGVRQWLGMAQKKLTL